LTHYLELFILELFLLLVDACILTPGLGVSLIPIITYIPYAILRTLIYKEDKKWIHLAISITALTLPLITNYALMTIDFQARRSYALEYASYINDKYTKNNECPTTEKESVTLRSSYPSIHLHCPKHKPQNARLHWDSLWRINRGEIWLGLDSQSIQRGHFGAFSH
jgi:hypothetical protein